MSNFFHHRRNAAGTVEILHVVLSCGGKTAQIGGAGADLIDGVQIKLHAGFRGDGRQMQRGIGGAAQRHIHRQGIVKGFRRQNITGAEIAFEQLHDLHPGVLGKMDPL